MMIAVFKLLHVLLCLFVSLKLLALAQEENQFIYHGFTEANLLLNGIAKIHPNGLLELTNTSKQQIGHAFFPFPSQFNTSLTNNSQSLSFSTQFVFAMVPELPTLGGHGIAFTISPSVNFIGALGSQYFGIFNSTSNGLSSNHVLAVELDTIRSPDFEDINDNHVGIDVNNLTSIESAPVTYFSDEEKENKSLTLISGNMMHAWIDYDEVEKLLNVTVAPITSTKPTWPLLSTSLDLSSFMLDSMYVGFSSSTGAMASSQYILGWSFNKSGQAQSLDLSKLPPLPPASNMQVAVKKVSHDSKQGVKEFVAEIVTMGRLRHRNLVQLLGYCRRKGELLLVYDYMPNGSLDKLLFRNDTPSLNWFRRYQILRGVASALLYLHEEWEQVVLHRDVKASNILLDADFHGRLGDFGLAKFHDRGANPHTTCVVGTVGYLAPEVTRTGRATTSSDVFAFGTLMLEMACGRKPIESEQSPEKMILVDWVLESWKRGDILGTCDPKLKGNYRVEEMELVLKLGLLCSFSTPGARPSMRQVVQYLDGNASLPEMPLDGASIGLMPVSHEASRDCTLSFHGSNDYSAYSLSSTDSILSYGR